MKGTKHFWDYLSYIVLTGGLTGMRPDGESNPSFHFIISTVTLNKSLNFSELQFYHFLNGNENTS